MSIKPPGSIDSLNPKKHRREAAEGDEVESVSYLGRIWRLHDPKDSPFFDQFQEMDSQPQVTPQPQHSTHTPFTNTPQHTDPFKRGLGDWSKGILRGLTLEEKILQLLVVITHSKADEEHRNHVEQLVEQYQVGGLMLMSVEGDLTSHIQWINRCQKKSRIPLLISSEGGSSIALEGVSHFPDAMVLGAIEEDHLIQESAKNQAVFLRSLGIHVQLVSLVDLDNHLSHLVARKCFFGDDKEQVVRKGIAYVKGLQEGGVIACPEVFPKCHYDEEVSTADQVFSKILHPLSRLDSQQLYPFKMMIREKVQFVLLPHIYIPILDSALVDSDLKMSGKWGEQGLVFADLISRHGMISSDLRGQVDLNEMTSREDIFLFSDNIPKAVESIKQAIVDGKISEDEIDQRVLKMLMVKEMVRKTEE